MPKKKRILIIDDDKLILSSIERQLKNEGLDLDLTTNPLDCINMIDNTDYNLIISDIKMKPITGLDLLKEIRMKKPDLPVIILSGYVDDNLVEQAKQLGANEFLIKPVKKINLIEAVHRHLS